MHKKRMLILFIIGVILTTVGVGGRYLQNPPTDLVNNENNVIRLHVLANSNNEDDQNLKNQVRDAILDQMAHRLSALEDSTQAKILIKDSLEEMKTIAEEEIKRRGYHYPVRVELGQFSFPTRQYGALVFPAGQYEAVRVIIGNGEGNNWWCVLFPPLCFVDATNGVAVQTSKEENQEQSEQDQYEYRFKVLELWRNNK